MHTYGGRGARAPHLSVGLLHLQAVLGYLAEIGVSMYRISPDLVPQVDDPLLVAHDLAHCAEECARVAAWVRAKDLRLSFHAPATVALASATPEVQRRSQLVVESLALVLDALGADENGVIVVHLGGAVGGLDAALGRWLTAWEGLPVAAQRRVVLEHDPLLSVGAALRLHAATGVPIVFDHLHWLLHNPEALALPDALGAVLATWPRQRTPKVHWASPRTELRAVARPAGAGQRRRWLLSPPRLGQHSDFAHPWEFIRFVEAAATLRPFDVMLEAKASDLALLRLRDDLHRYAPTLIHRWTQMDTDGAG